MKKLFIYTAFRPLILLSNEGLGRYLCFLVKGIIENGCPVLIAMPSWSEESMRELFADNGIPQEKVEFLTTGSLPIALQLYFFLKKRKVNRPKVHSFLSKAISFVKKSLNPRIVFAQFLAQSNFLIMLGLFLIIALLSPIFLLIFIITYIPKLFRSSIIRLLKRLSLYELTVAIVSKSSHPMMLFRNNVFIDYVLSIIYKKEVGRLIKKINKRKDISTCLVPTLFWPEIKKINCNKKIIVCPDVVISEFPYIFRNYLAMHETISETVELADKFICYSDHVKKIHLMKQFSVPSQKITVIKHACSLLSDSLNLYQKFSLYSSVEKRDICCQILSRYQKEHLRANQYLRDFNFSGARFIFYSSQVRPHKNLLNLIKMYETLLRKRYVNVKLILTGNIQLHNEIYNYVKENGLINDVIAFPKIPGEVLAALNYLAICAINPTFFEGGFPFTFSEAYSVGTPSVMSSIPVVLEEVQDLGLRKTMLFNPYDIEDMVNKTEWAINNPEKLLMLQKPLFEKLCQRTWKDVVNEYLCQIYEDHKIITPRPIISHPQLA